MVIKNPKAKKVIKVSTPMPKYDLESSPSYSWMSKFFDTVDAKLMERQINQFRDANETDYTQILKNVTRTANVVGNSRNDEKDLQVKWMQSENASTQNTCASDIVYVSPDIVGPRASCKPAWTIQKLTDVIIGEVLTESAMKRTMDPAVEASMTASAPPNPKRHKSILDSTHTKVLVHKTWLVAERLAAKVEVLRQYPGFEEYFNISRDYYTNRDTTNEIEAGCNIKPTDATVTAALQWSLLQDKPLNLREDVYEIVYRHSVLIKMAETSANRLERSIAAIKEIQEKFPNDPKSEIDQLGAPDDLRGEPPSIHTDPTFGDAICSAELVVTASHVSDYVPPKGSEEIHMAASKSGYQAALLKLKPAIEALRWRLNFTSEYERDIEHGLRRGRIDEGSIYKLGFGQQCQEDTLFENEEIPAPKDIVVALLVDESGSMAYAPGRGSTRQEIARSIAIVVANALMQIKGVTPVVVGHTAQAHGSEPVPAAGKWSKTGATLIHYLTPDNPVPSSMWKISSRVQNLDGIALGMLAKRLMEWYPNEHKVIVHLNDGTPEGYDYSGAAAVEHTAKMISMIRNDGIEVVCVGIDDDNIDPERVDAYRAMYGSRFALVDTHKAFAAIANMIVNAVSAVCKK